VDDDIFGRGAAGLVAFRFQTPWRLPAKPAAFGQRRPVSESCSLMRHHRMRNPHDSFRNCEWRTPDCAPARRSGMTECVSHDQANGDERHAPGASGNDFLSLTNFHRAVLKPH
jgi:hypothetical protein